MKSTAAPFYRSDIGDGFGEVPAVAVEILSVVLALAVGMVLRLRQDDGAALAGTGAVSVGVFDADLNVL